MKRPLRGLLLVGTDTGVGKTAVGQALLRLSARRGLALVPFKPAESGYTPGEADSEKLLSALGATAFHVEQICPYRFPAPIAPALAAQLSGRPISRDLLSARATALRACGDALLVESAGGLLTPYSTDLTSADLADLFDIDILLIAANRLGTINHTALAVAYIQQRQLPLAGIVLVDVDPKPTPDKPYNCAQIAAVTGIAPLGLLRFCPQPQPDQLADAACADLDLRTLLGGRLATPDVPSAPPTLRTR